MTDYPEAIYATKAGDTLTPKQRKLSGWARENAYDLGYQDGLAASDSLEGWSNLTAAIQEEAPIDWGKLDGMTARCLKPDYGFLTHKLERDTLYEIDDPNGWWRHRGKGLSFVWGSALDDGWKGKDGWMLYVKGPIPLRVRTADTLEPGTGFKGKCMGEVRDCLMYQEAPAYHEVDGEEVGPVAELKVVGTNLYPRESCESASPGPVNWLASQVEVLEVYGVGTFQKQENQL